MNKTQDPVNLQFDSEYSKGFCCTNESSHLKYFGTECGKFLSQTPGACNFTEIYKLFPCNDKFDLQYNSKYCKVPNKSCIIEIYSVSKCRNQISLDLCDVKQYSCTKLM
jgi:hypothetical protein